MSSGAADPANVHPNPIRNLYIWNVHVRKVKQGLAIMFYGPSSDEHAYGVRGRLKGSGNDHEGDAEKNGSASSEAVCNIGSEREGCQAANVLIKIKDEIQLVLMRMHLTWMALSSPSWGYPV